MRNSSIFGFVGTLPEEIPRFRTSAVSKGGASRFEDAGGMVELDFIGRSRVGLSEKVGII